MDVQILQTEDRWHHTFAGYKSCLDHLLSSSGVLQSHCLRAVRAIQHEVAIGAIVLRQLKRATIASSSYSDATFQFNRKDTAALLIRLPEATTVAMKPHHGFTLSGVGIQRLVAAGVFRAKHVLRGQIVIVSGELSKWVFFGDMFDPGRRDVRRTIRG
jgi:hypothetical protein